MSNDPTAPEQLKRQPAFKRWYGDWQNGAEVAPMQAAEPHEDLSTVEEVMLSAPYSDVESWEKILALRIRQGTSRFRGPPGLLEKMAARLSSSTDDPETT